MDPPAKLPSPSGPVQAHMLQSASNISITGGQFSVSQTIVHDPAHQARIQMVHDRAAPNAILNQGGRADEVRCHPGTREEVLAKSETWMDPPVGQPFNLSRKGIFWLSGPAGAGKSAIMQTLAERRQAQGLPVANFFFFRNDASRDDAGPLVATILTQLLDLYRDLKPLICAVLEQKPNILRQSLRNQFEHLIDMPIRTLRAANPSLIQQPIVLLIDGLDECSSAAKHEQQLLLKVLHDLVSRDNSPFLVCVASRPESHLTMAFNEVGASVDSIFLNEDYRPEDDIRRFVLAELARIKKNHSLGHYLDVAWPPNEHVRQIVAKSSGQFIYAATVLRFIAGSSASPSVSLDKVQGLRPINSSSPFAELDAIYTYILSQVEDWKAAKTVLTYRIIIDSPLRGSFRVTPRKSGPFLHPLGYQEEDVLSSMSDLTALVKFNGHELIFYHASFPDFLCDKTRSEGRHIDLRQFADLEAVNFITSIQDADSVAICNLIMQYVSGPTQSLTDALKSPPSVPTRPGYISSSSDLELIALEFISVTLYHYCGSDSGLYRRLAHKWVAWFQLGGIRFEFPTESGISDLYQTAIQNIESKLGKMVWQEILNTRPGSPGHAQQTGRPVRNSCVQQPTDRPPELLDNSDNIGSKQSSPQPQRQPESRRSTRGIKVSRPASQGPGRSEKTISGKWRNGARTTSTPTPQQQAKKQPPWR